MFKKLIDFCKINKEKQMPTTNTDTRGVKALKSEIKTQKEQITRLLNRINTMSDEIHGLKNDLGRFKKNVANDVKYLTEKVDG
tara:strand:- start:851 stop:1099 length:249 start_codon:yes stop_codon:yes gene_type:complete